jgi:hypothetical protein
VCLVGSAARRIAERLGDGARAALGPQEALVASALAVARTGAALHKAELYGLEPMYVEPILA